MSSELIYNQDAIKKIDQAIKYGLTACALQAQSQAKALIKEKKAIDTGRLLNSIEYKISGYSAKIGTNVEYACIFGAQTSVKCKDGNKIISMVNPDDMVLTQTGEYHKVLARIEHKAKDFPDMVEVICQYRNGRNHTLRTTENHKFLVYREGRNKWVEAKDLLITDKLYSLKKIPHNKNIGYCTNCLNCKKRFKPQGAKLSHKYCSMNCRNEYHRINGNPNTGSKRTLETRLKQSKHRKEFHILHPEKHINKILSKKGFQTDIERKIEKWLIDRNVNFEKQKKIGIIYADFYLPDTNEIIEGDGAFWHSNQNKDIKRDLYIKQINPNVKITHLHFYDKRFSKNINSNPIDNVYYEVCNPDINSFIDMEKFEFKNIISIRPFIYKKGGKNDAMQAKIYDLSVDKVHSYYANGILVSNSYIEYGTKSMPPRSYLRESLDLLQEDLLQIFQTVWNKVIGRD